MGAAMENLNSNENMLRVFYSQPDSSWHLKQNDVDLEAIYPSRQAAIIGALEIVEAVKLEIRRIIIDQ